MPIPSTGPVGMSDVNSTIGVASTTYCDMSWIEDNTKIAATDLNAIRSFNWFQLNGSPVVKNCTNCSNCVGAQCRDAKAWLQANCNCNCTGNCNTNCNCNCRC